MLGNFTSQSGFRESCCPFWRKQWLISLPLIFMELAKNLGCNEFEHLDWRDLSWLPPDSSEAKALLKLCFFSFFLSLLLCLDVSGFVGTKSTCTIKQFKVCSAASFGISVVQQSLHSHTEDIDTVAERNLMLTSSLSLLLSISAHLKPRKILHQLSLWIWSF